MGGLIAIFLVVGVPAGIIALMMRSCSIQNFYLRMFLGILCLIAMALWIVFMWIENEGGWETLLKEEEDEE